MNETAASKPGASLVPDTTDLFTAAHLALIVVLAVLVIAGLIFGARLARRRREARRELRQHNIEIQEQTPVLPAGPPPLAPEFRATPVPPLPRAAPPPPTAIPQPDPAVVEMAPAPAASTDTSAADGPVTQLKGLGPKVALRLGELGIITVGQLAALTDDEAAALDAQLGPFTGRMGRDRWQEQARFLAAGDRAGFEAVFGRL